MRFSRQNLDDEQNPRYWSHGRAWLRRSGEWYDRRGGTLRVEWAVPMASCSWDITVGGGDSGQDLGVTIAIPWLLTLYVTLERVFRPYAFGTDFDRGHDRQIGLSFHGGAIWYRVWVGSMASWSRTYPWCRWWRQGSFHFAELLGKQRYTREVIQAGIRLMIPMPEGTYPATATIERCTWKRPLGFARRRVFVDVKVPKGIPFAGKGENSWDCGDDGLFGYSVEGTSLDKAIAHGVESVLRSRRRNGQPSADAIKEALAR